MNLSTAAQVPQDTGDPGLGGRLDQAGGDHLLKRPNTSIGLAYHTFKPKSQISGLERLRDVVLALPPVPLSDYQCRPALQWSQLRSPIRITMKPLKPALSKESIQHIAHSSRSDDRISSWSDLSSSGYCTHREIVEIHDPFDAFLKLRQIFGSSSVFLLESCSGPAVDGRESFIGVTGPLEISVRRSNVKINGTSELADSILKHLVRARVVRVEKNGLVRLTNDSMLWELPRAVGRVFDVAGNNTSFGSGFLSYFGYDVVHYIEHIPRSIETRPDDPPDAIFVLVRGLIEVKKKRVAGVLTSLTGPGIPLLPLNEIHSALQRPVSKASAIAPDYIPFNVEDEISRTEYMVSVDRCLEHIRLGDIYQVQLGHEMAITTGVDCIEVYRRLRNNNPSPFMIFLPLRECTIVGASPELFLRIENDLVTMRPIAGTASISFDRGYEDRKAHRLPCDPKELAEHVMLVDLCRNDLSRFAAVSSLAVDDLMSSERFSHLFHLVSTVTAKIGTHHDVYDVIRACFPSGTMTGAPKLRAMEIIESEELSRRGYYAGTLGLVGFGGWAELCLTIRMAVHSGNRYMLRASAGIVSDSVKESEWDETLAKLSATYLAITGKELT